MRVGARSGRSAVLAQMRAPSSAFHQSGHDIGRGQSADEMEGMASNFVIAA